MKEKEKNLQVNYEFWYRAIREVEKNSTIWERTM